MAFITDAQLKTQLAAALKLASSASLPVGWDDIIAKSNLAAYQTIVAKLSGRGYTAAQIAGWDQGAEFNTDIGLFWCLVKGAGLHGNDPTFINKLDRRAELDTCDVMVGGVLQSPGSGLQVVGFGNLDTDDDTYTRETTW